MEAKGRWPLGGPSRRALRARSLGVIGVAALGVVALACGTGSSSPAAQNNRAACERYAEHLNSLSACVGLIYDPDNWCKGADQLPVDMSEYYDCLRANAVCDGPVARIESDRCMPPLIQLGGEPALGSEQGVSGGELSGGRASREGVSGDGVSGGEEK